MNPTTPAAIVAPATVERASIVTIWREQQEHSASDHALYALARLIHSAKKAKIEGYASSEEFKVAALSKLVRTFSPVHKPSKINNGRRPFGVLLAQLEGLKSYGADTRLGVVGQLPADRFNVSNEQLREIGALASELFVEARLRGNSGLYLLAAPLAPPRVKKLYVRE